MRVKDLHSTLIVIFRPDELPFNVLSQDETGDRFAVNYGLTHEKPPFPVPGIQQSLVFVNGRFSANNAYHTIGRIVIEPRRILITVNSTTAVAKALLDQIKNLIQEVELRETAFKYEPVSLTYETQSTVQFDADYSDLFTNSPVAQIGKLLLNTLPDYNSNLDVYPVSVRFRVGYHDPPESLLRSRISLVEKTVKIEIKEKTDPSEHLIFASSPADSDTHLKLLEMIEKMISENQSPTAAP